MPTLLQEALAAAAETKDYREGLGAVAQTGTLFQKHFPGRKALLVAASDTWAAAGAAVEASLKAAGVPLVPAVILEVPPFLHADYAWIEKLRDQVKAAGAVPVAVGSGTVNDLVKRAAHEAGERYLCVATASSVDGYTSSGAAILKEGFKQTLACPAPLAVVADSTILETAPAYLTSSGYGDLASKLIAGADWLLADAVGADPVVPFAFRLTQETLRDTLAAPTALGLFNGLALTGFAMQFTKSSRPVSGCEHLFSHVWEMEDLHFGGRPVTHGHKVAVGTLIATAIYEVALGDDLAPAVHHPSAADREAQVRREFVGSPAAAGAVEGAVKVAVGKLSAETAARRLEAARPVWPALAARIRAQLIPYAELKDAFARAGCPVRAEDIGLTRTYAIRTARRAQMIRDRYGVLDLLFDTGRLEAVLDRVLAEPAYLG